MLQKYFEIIWDLQKPFFDAQDALQPPNAEQKTIISSGLGRLRNVKNFDQKFFQSQKSLFVYRFKNASKSFWDHVRTWKKKFLVHKTPYNR